MTKNSETVAAQPFAAPIKVRERHWGPRNVGLAILAVVVGALGVTGLVGYVRGGTLYVAVAKPVAFGQQITADDLTSVRVNNGSGLTPIADADRSTVVGKYAAVALVPGSLLTKGQVLDQAVPGPGKQVLSVTLKSDQAPAYPLAPGTPVALVRTQNTGLGSTTADQNAVPTPVAGTVRAVRTLEYGGGVVVDVIVKAADGPAIAGAAATGHVALLVTEGTSR